MQYSNSINNKIMQVSQTMNALMEAIFNRRQFNTAKLSSADIQARKRFTVDATRENRSQYFIVLCHRRSTAVDARLTLAMCQSAPIGMGCLPIQPEPWLNVSKQLCFDSPTGNKCVHAARHVACRSTVDRDKRGLSIASRRVASSGYEPALKLTRQSSLWRIRTVRSAATNATAVSA
jgi:hypothetical protein